MTEKLPNSLTFEYKIHPNHNVYAINGIYGGINVNGQIVMHVFTERKAIPQKETYELNPEGSLSDSPISTEGKDTIIRNVTHAFSFDVSLARSMAKWLLEKADEADKIFKKQKDGADNDK